MAEESCSNDINKILMFWMRKFCWESKNGQPKNIASERKWVNRYGCKKEKRGKKYVEQQLKAGKEFKTWSYLEK